MPASLCLGQGFLYAKDDAGNDCVSAVVLDGNLVVAGLLVVQHVPECEVPIRRVGMLAGPIVAGEVVHGFGSILG